MRKLTLDNAIKVAEDKGGKCLSTEYVRSADKLIWQCSEGHVWRASLHNVKSNGRWCAKCAIARNKLDLNEAQQIAASKGGKCLSKEYINANSKMQWQCIKGHIWEAKLDGIKYKNRWCPTCADTRLTLAHCHEAALNRGGRCISTEYINTKTKMKWQCDANHIWEASYESIIRMCSWCPYCAKRAKLTLEECILFAQSKNGRCLSLEYKTNGTKMLWQCHKGHKWEATFAHIKNGKWCPHCVHHISKPQIQIYEFILLEFPQLDIKLNDTKTISPKHLDIYLPLLQIAIEFDGEYWHYSQDAIDRGAQDRMTRKDLKCAELGIKLLRIRERDYLNDKDGELRKIKNFILTNFDENLFLPNL